LIVCGAVLIAQRLLTHYTANTWRCNLWVFCKYGLTADEVQASKYNKP
jgi:hypothetical protein